MEPIYMAGPWITEKEIETVLDAMRTGSQDGMQHFDGEIEKLIRASVIDMETGLSYATNAGNLRLELADLAGPPPPEAQPEPPKAEPAGETELEIER